MTPAGTACSPSTLHLLPLEPKAAAVRDAKRGRACGSHDDGRACCLQLLRGGASSSRPAAGCCPCCRRVGRHTSRSCSSQKPPSGAQLPLPLPASCSRLPAASIGPQAVSGHCPHFGAHGDALKVVSTRGGLPAAGSCTALQKGLLPALKPSKTCLKVHKKAKMMHAWSAGVSAATLCLECPTVRKPHLSRMWPMAGKLHCMGVRCGVTGPERYLPMHEERKRKSGRLLEHCLLPACRLGASNTSISYGGPQNGAQQANDGTVQSSFSQKHFTTKRDVLEASELAAVATGRCQRQAAH